MPPSLNPVLSTARNALVTQKTHFPLPSMPVLAQVPRYHVNSISKSGFFQTKYLGFAGGFDVLKGSVKNLRAGSLLQKWN